MNTNANPVLNRLLDNLNGQTAAMLDKLAGLDAEILEAFHVAELAAEARVREYAASIEAALERRLHAFAGRLDDLVADAVEDVLVNIAGRLDLAENPKPPTYEQLEAAADAEDAAADAEDAAARDEVLAKIEEAGKDDPQTHQEARQDDPTVEAAPEPAEAHDEPQATAGEQEQADPEEARCEVAAQAVEADDDLAVLADPDDDPDGPPCALPLTASPEGLHERQERDGRRAKYTPAGRPEAGGVYWLRDHRRHWQPVVFQPAE